MYIHYTYVFGLPYRLASLLMRVRKDVCLSLCTMYNVHTICTMYNICRYVWLTCISRGLFPYWPQHFCFTNFWYRPILYNCIYNIKSSTFYSTYYSSYTIFQIFHCIAILDVAIVNIIMHFSCFHKPRLLLTKENISSGMLYFVTLTLKSKHFKLCTLNHFTTVSLPFHWVTAVCISLNSVTT